MKFQKKEKPFKKCPRCNNKVLANQTRCEECGLLFSRLEFASNKAAKKKLRKFDRDYIIYTNQYPKDVSKIKILILSALLGLFGAHYYYVGKYLKGILMSLGMIYTVFCVIFNPAIMEMSNGSYLFVPIGIMVFSWIISVSYVVFGKFKVPVIVDLPKTENGKEILQEKIDAENKKDEKLASKTQKNQKKVEISVKSDVKKQKEDKK